MPLRLSALILLTTACAAPHGYLRSTGQSHSKESSDCKNWVSGRELKGLGPVVYQTASDSDKVIHAYYLDDKPLITLVSLQEDKTSPVISFFDAASKSKMQIQRKKFFFYPSNSGQRLGIGLRNGSNVALFVEAEYMESGDQDPNEIYCEVNGCHSSVGNDQTKINSVLQSGRISAHKLEALAKACDDATTPEKWVHLDKIKNGLRNDCNMSITMPTLSRDELLKTCRIFRKTTMPAIIRHASGKQQAIRSKTWQPDNT